MQKAIDIKVICIDDVILWLGTRESMKTELGRNFVGVGNKREGIGDRWERTYVCNYEKARDEFKRELALAGFSGAYYFDSSPLANGGYYLKGYPVREKNKNKGQSG
jgi:hypothetical protein